SPHFFFSTDPATTEISTLSLHDALPIYSFCPWSSEIQPSTETRPMLLSGLTSSNCSFIHDDWTTSKGYPAGPVSWMISAPAAPRSEEHTSELQSRRDLVCRLLLEKKKKT